MKIGLVISAVILVVVALTAFLLTRGVADLPTAATRAAHLERVALPSDLPALWQPRGEGTADAAYERMLDAFDAHAEVLFRPNPPPAVVDQIIEPLVEAMDAPALSPGLFDDWIPLKPGNDAEFGTALERIPSIVLARAREAYAADRPHALRSVLALWALGQRLFEDHVRLYNRWLGLQIMEAASAQLLAWEDDLPADSAEHLRQWKDYLASVLARWEPKMQLVRSVRPHIGDLVHMARREQDPSFRIEAVLMLGVAKYNPGHRANHRAILAAIDELGADPDPRVARAAQVADALSVEEVRRMR